VLFDQQTGAYHTSTGVQAANALPLSYGVAEQGGVDIVRGAAAALIDAFVNGEVNGSTRIGSMHVSTGIFGTDGLLQVFPVSVFV
jgi:hypothetical protein